MPRHLAMHAIFSVFLLGRPGAFYCECNTENMYAEHTVFGAEFVAMKVAMEASRSIRHKLRMMGIEITGPTYTYGDNMSVIHNTQRPESVLKKKSNSVCYHAVRESVAMDEMRTSHIRSEFNAADICTKVITVKSKRDSLIKLLLYYLAD